MHPIALALVEPLAKSGEAGKSGPIGLAVVLVLCVVSYFLFKSMSKHMRKVRDEFPRDGVERKPEPPAPVKPEARPVQRGSADQDDAT